MMDWPNWIVYPVLAFFAVPFWLRVTIAVGIVALIGAWLFG